MAKMKQFTANEEMAVFAGRVKMDKPQAFPRSGRLVPVPGLPSVYEISGFIILAPGETVLIDPVPGAEKPVPKKTGKKK